MTFGGYGHMYEEEIARESAMAALWPQYWYGNANWLAQENEQMRETQSGEEEKKMEYKQSYPFLHNYTQTRHFYQCLTSH